MNFSLTIFEYVNLQLILIFYYLKKEILTHAHPHAVGAHGHGAVVADDPDLLLVQVLLVELGLLVARRARPPQRVLRVDRPAVVRV
jgi:hypothetical protein